MHRLLLAFSFLCLTSASNLWAQPTPLAIGESVEHELGSHDTHDYTLELGADQFVYGVVDQQTVDVVVTVYDPDDTLVGTFDNPARGPEPFQFNTERAGTYRIDVNPFQEESGLYTIRIHLVEPLATTLEGQVDQLMAMYNEDTPGGAIAVIKEGEISLAKGYGMANLELHVPDTPKTKFRIGSITKQFTSMAVLILQDRGQLRVEDSVGDHIESVPELWQDLTIHQLLTHTSGIMHSWNLPGFAETMMVPATLEGTLERYYDQPLVFEPGSGFQYSGVGYFLLAKIIEEVSGQTYEEFIKTEIFLPIGMHNTGADRNEMVLSDRASGYQRLEDGTIQNAAEIYIPILTGGGNLYSTVEDLALWDRALARHELVSEDAYEMIFKPEREGYAYGWVIGQLDGKETISHSGGVPGFNAHILRIPEEDICVIVLMNQVPGQASTVAQALARLVLSEAN